ncbi:hypothetical protein Droror1_Dr00003210 [Drosera rotundifolia]
METWRKRSTSRGTVPSLLLSPLQRHRTGAITSASIILCPCRSCGGERARRKSRPAEKKQPPEWRYFSRVHHKGETVYDDYIEMSLSSNKVVSESSNCLLPKRNSVVASTSSTAAPPNRSHRICFHSPVSLEIVRRRKSEEKEPTCGEEAAA